MSSEAYLGEVALELCLTIFPPKMRQILTALSP
jgi:hypothetical protein